VRSHEIRRRWRQHSNQENAFDCGVYIVAFVEALLYNVPVHFGPLDSIVARQKLRRNLFGHPDDVPELLVLADRLDMTVRFRPGAPATYQAAGQSGSALLCSVCSVPEQTEQTEQLGLGTQGALALQALQHLDSFYIDG